MQVPAAEHEVSADLVRQLLADQHPDLAARPLAYLAEGFDVTLWRLGEDLAVRLPRRGAAEVGVRNEQRWLVELAPALPLPVPAPVRVGAPGRGFPFVWSVVPYLRGEPLLGGPALDGPLAAATLGGFLRSLHVPAPPSAPRSEVRGTPVAARHESFVERVGLLGGDAAAATKVWQAASVAAPHRGAPCWVHGDLHAGNVLVRDGDLVGVLDFIDLNAGDPATDLASAWLLLDPDHVHGVLAAYGDADADLVARARGWAVLFAAFFVALGHGGRDDYGTEGARMLRRVLDGPG